MLPRKVLAWFLGFFIGVFAVANASSSIPQRPAEKDWTILTFLNGFNNLDPYGVQDVNEMEVVGSTDRVHVVTQWAHLATKKVQRLYIEKDNDRTRITSPVIEDLGQIDMGDYRNLIDFVKWAVARYPAKHYMINIWNHGNGWHRVFGEPSSRDVSYDDLSGNKITTEQLGLASSEIARDLGKKIDIFSSDSCLMSMVEVIGQMKEDVGHFIGSQEVEPAPGWPYERFLQGFPQNRTLVSAEVAELLTRVYAESYPNQTGITLSGLGVSSYPALALAVRELGEEIRLLPLNHRHAVQQIVSRTQSFLNSDYKDLGDLLTLLASEPTIPIRPDLIVNAQAALRNFVIANRTSQDMARSQGVSIWYPETAWQYNAYRSRYNALVFNLDTGWSDVIQSTLSAARIVL